MPSVEPVTRTRDIGVPLGAHHGGHGGSAIYCATTAAKDRRRRQGLAPSHESDAGPPGWLPARPAWAVSHAHRSNHAALSTHGWRPADGVLPPARRFPCAAALLAPSPAPQTPARRTR